MRQGLEDRAGGAVRGRNTYWKNGSINQPV
jgi:hypothetical protein